MPEMDGFVFISASAQRDQIAECFRHGAATHLAKPFTMAELRSRVAQFAKS
jgi:CheY-like chemotaxis protein